MRLAEVGYGVLDRSAFQTEQRREFLLIKLLHTGIDAVRQGELKKGPLFGIEG